MAAEDGPSWVGLWRSGELASRVQELRALLARCTVCPHDCGIDRLADERARCFSGRDAIVSAWTPHFGEEPMLSGTRGVGNVFFGQCNLRCVYCQNWQISQPPRRASSIGASAAQAQTLDAEALAEVYLQLQHAGCHLLGLVSPSHVVPQAIEALELAAAQGFRLPLVYNTNAYDSLQVLRLLDGVIDIYLPDLKYAQDAAGWRYSKVARYAEVSRAAIVEMARQVGTSVDVGIDGVAQRGLIVRHLVLPNGLADSKDTLNWLAHAVGTDVHLSVMAQYFPTADAVGPASRYPLLTRRVRAAEYDEVVDLVIEIGFEHAIAQEHTSADYYAPDFEDRVTPFADIVDFPPRPADTSAEVSASCTPA